jgi:hypothetical protein
VSARAVLIGLVLLVALPASALGAQVTINARSPAQGALVDPPAPQEISVTFNVTVKNPVTNPGSSWTVQPVVNGVGGLPLPGGVATTTDNKKWTLSFGGLLLGSNLTYRVTLKNIESPGNTTLQTATWDFTTRPDAQRAPAVLDGITAALTDGGVAISWSAPTDFDRAGVNIYRKTGAAVPTTADDLVGSFPDGVTQVLDTGVQAGQTYTYAAFPYDHDPSPGLGPSVVSEPVRMPAPPDPAPTPVTVPPPAPTPTPAPVAVTKSPVVVSRLLLPTKSTLIRGTALKLRWRKNAQAAYYNVQLFKGKRKMLSVFPSATTLVISPKVLRTAGSYRLLIWSGLGARTLGRYERAPWVTKTLVVKAPSKPTKA